MPAHKKIPVILDTDIGGDIDDTWAIAMMLRSPELDVKLITSATGNTVYRAKIIARLLEVAQRTDIPVGVGVYQDQTEQGQAGWVRDYNLERYPGQVHADGVDAIVKTIMQSPEPVTLICIGPLPNIRLALAREPRIAQHCHFVGMFGSIAKNHDGASGAIAEFNVVCDPPAARKVFSAPWLTTTITPLDTCGQVRLKGKKYQAIADSNDELLKAVMLNYRMWLGQNADQGCSSILYDTVAIHLACSRRFLKMERTGLDVTMEGFTKRDPHRPPVDIAIEWADLPGYEDFLVNRLQGKE